MIRNFALYLAMALLAAITLAQAAQDASMIVGQWTGILDGLPALRLEVQENDGKLTGAVLFYQIRRDRGAVPTASPGFPEPMIDLVFDGNTLWFKINHRYSHPPRTLNDPPVSFHIEVTGPDRARLFSAELPPLEITRQKYR